MQNILCAYFVQEVTLVIQIELKVNWVYVPGGKKAMIIIGAGFFTSSGIRTSSDTS